MTTPPEQAVTTAVKTIFANTFASEGWTLADDRLLRAAGKDGTEAAIYPVTSLEKATQVQELIVTVTVQLYLAFDPEPNEDYVVDPNVIIGYADRLRRAFQSHSSGNTDDLWWLRLTGVTYPVDPTGNVSRFEATVEAHCSNPAAYA